MPLKLTQLTKWSGEINQREYLIWGLILFAIKYNLDRLIAFAFDRSWYITDYFLKVDEFSVTTLSESDQLFYFMLLTQSLPFIWFGTVLCLKRLRNAGLSTRLVILFFVPFLNFLFFMLLSAMPEKQKEPKKAPFLSKLIPQSKYGSAFLALGLVTIISIFFTLLFVNYLKEYGWSLFVGIPFFLGFGSVLIYGQNKNLKYREALGVMLIAILCFNLVIFILAFEGILCLAMGFPILLFIGWIGATIAFAILESNRPATINVFAAPLATIMLLGAFESFSDSTPPLMAVKTEVIIYAEKQEVWNKLVAFSQIEEPKELLFQTGIAYPIHAEISGKGVGAIRKCNFTTGAFIEPITIWEEPHRLQFSVLEQPAPMVEWSIYKDIKIEHLDGYFKSEKGQFLLTALPDGSTKLTGTTWYSHDIWPSFYWSMWSDFILHQIHLRVLNHIKEEAERKIAH